MAYIRKDKKVCIEIFSTEGADKLRHTLEDRGYVFSETEFLSNQFWGNRFVIDKPIGKGASARLNFLMEEITK